MKEKKTSALIRWMTAIVLLVASVIIIAVILCKCPEQDREGKDKPPCVEFHIKNNSTGKGPTQ